MSDILIHPSTEVILKALVDELPQSLLITGPKGVGIRYFTEHLAELVGGAKLVVLPEKDEKVDLEKGTITVASIRRLYEQTKTVTMSRRLVIIDYAERMGVQAQNAFLKLLEEPGERTHFILLTHQPTGLLPTIRSRVRIVDVQPVTVEQSEHLLDTLNITDPRRRAQLLFIAAGLPAELTRLATDEATFTKRSQIVKDARQFLQGSAYDRLKLAQQYKDDRQDALELLSDALKLIQRSVREGKSSLVPAIEPVLAAYEQIEANGNVRLHLAAAMV